MRIIPVPRSLKTDWLKRQKKDQNQLRQSSVFTSFPLTDRKMERASFDVRHVVLAIKYKITYLIS